MAEDVCCRAFSRAVRDGGLICHKAVDLPENSIYRKSACLKWRSNEFLSCNQDNGYTHKMELILTMWQPTNLFVVWVVVLQMIILIAIQFFNTLFIYFHSQQWLWHNQNTQHVYTLCINSTSRDNLWKVPNILKKLNLSFQVVLVYAWCKSLMVKCRWV